MKIVVTVSFLMILVSFTMQEESWSVPEKESKKENPVTSSEKSISSGGKIYKKMCWSCHGDEGKGNGPAATSLTPKPADFTSEKFQKQTDGAIFWKLSTGKGSMAAYENSLTEDQRWSIVNYLRSLKK